jgi:hypothetical protein
MRDIMAFRYFDICRLRRAHNESITCMFFPMRTAHSTMVH